MKSTLGLFLFSSLLLVANAALALPQSLQMSGSISFEKSGDAQVSMILERRSENERKASYWGKITYTNSKSSWTEDIRMSCYKVPNGKLKVEVFNSLDPMLDLNATLNSEAAIITQPFELTGNLTTTTPCFGDLEDCNMRVVKLEKVRLSIQNHP